MLRGKKMPDKKSFHWLSQDNLWQISLSIYGMQKEYSFHLISKSEKMEEKMKLCMEEISMDIEDEYASCTQEQFESAFQKSTDFHLQFENGEKVILYYRGEEE